MGLLEEAKVIQKDKATRLYPCAVVVLFTELGKSDAAELEAALADKTIDAVTLATVLRNRGHQIGNKQIQNHRAGRCPCGR